MAKISERPKNLKRDKRGPKMPEAAVGVKFVETIAKKPEITVNPGVEIKPLPKTGFGGK